MCIINAKDAKWTPHYSEILLQFLVTKVFFYKFSLLLSKKRNFQQVITYPKPKFQKSLLGFLRFFSQRDKLFPEWDGIYLLVYCVFEAEYFNEKMSPLDGVNRRLFSPSQKDYFLPLLTTRVWNQSHFSQSLGKISQTP